MVNKTIEKTIDIADSEKVNVERNLKMPVSDENNLAKSKMAEELFEMGYTPKSIERILNIRLKKRK